MNEQGFRRKVKMQIAIQPELDLNKDKAIIEAVINLWIKDKDDFYQSEISRVIQLICRLKALSPTNEASIKLNFTPHNLITSEELVKKITPYVEQVRKEIFNTTTAPFEDIEKAVLWIEAKAKKPLSASAKRQKEKIIKHNLTRPLLDYASPDYKYTKAIYAWHPDLNKLSKATNLISTGTAFDKHFVTTFILTGLKPIVKRFEISRQRGFSGISDDMLENFCINIKVNSMDLTFNELKDIYNSIRKELNLTKKGHLKEKDYKLYDKVQQLCKAQQLSEPPKKPQKGIENFWLDIAKDCNFQGKQKAQIACTAYKRILKKINPEKC